MPSFSKKTDIHSMGKNIFDLAKRPKLNIKPKKPQKTPSEVLKQGGSHSVSKSPSKQHFSNPIELENITEQTSNVIKNPGEMPKKPLNLTGIKDDEIQKLLIGYICLPREKWSELKKNDHIRYRRSDNHLFRRGGWVFNQLVNSQTQKRVFQLITNSFLPPSPTNRIWMVGYDDIETLWVKQKMQETTHSDAESDNAETSSDECENPNQNTNLTANSASKQGGAEKILPLPSTQPIVGPSLQTQIESLKVEVMRLGNEQKNIINLIKRLHHIG